MLQIFNKIKYANKKSFNRSLPVNLDYSHKSHFYQSKNFKCPHLYIYYFKKVNCLPDSTLFYSFLPLSISFPFFKKRLKHHSIKGIFDIVKNWKSYHFNGVAKYLIIHDQWTSNYYHWLTQALPRLLMVQNLGNLKLLLPKNHQEDFHLETLRIFGIDSYYFLNTENSYYKIRNLYYPTHDIQIGDYNDDLIKKVAGKLRIEDKPVEKIFINRKSKKARKIINESEVIETFQKHDFKIVTFEDLTFLDQRVLMSKTLVLAGVHGAGLANMMFMQEGSKILELTTRLQGDQYYYYTLSSALNNNYYYQYCKSDDNSKSIQQADLYVDISELEENLGIILKNG